MKTPISYYGGKTVLVPHITPLLLTPHVRYVEPFFGGGAVYWAKNPSQLETINDIDDRVINFYQTVQSNFEELYPMIQATLHSESQHKEAARVLRNIRSPKIKRAWAFWVSTNMSFSHKMMGGFAFSQDNDQPRTTANFKRAFNLHLNARLRHTEIFARDALNVIELKDASDTLYYFDPPYIGTDLGHYRGYKRKDWLKFLDMLPNLKGRFILSSYPDPDLTEVVKKHDWPQRFVEKNIGVTGKKASKLKTESITCNYQLERGTQLRLY